MPRKDPDTNLENAIQEAAEQFAARILELIRTATIDELAALTASGVATAARKRPAAKAAPKKRGRPPKAEVAPEAPRKRGRPAKVVKAEEAPKKKRKKRAWPKCTHKGCEKNVYMPSGPKKMCYEHYMETGGKPSPLVAYRKKQAATKTKGKKASPKAKTPAKKTIVRKAADRKKPVKGK